MEIMTLLPSVNAYNLPVLLAALLNLALIAFLSLRHRWTPLHRAFALWNAALAVWNIGAFGIYGAQTAEAAVWWSRFCCYGIAFIPGTFLNFILALVEFPRSYQRRLVQAAFVLGASLLIADHFLPGFLAGDVVRRFWGFGPVGGPGATLLDPLLAASSIYPLFLLRRELSGAQGTRRNQLWYVFWGAAIAFIGGAFNVLAIHGINIYPFGNLVNPLYSLIIAYAIVEHGLMDIRIVLQQGAVYGLLSGGLTVVYLSIVAALQKLFGHYGIQENVVFYTAAFPVTVVLAPSMKTRIEPYIDRTLFGIQTPDPGSALKIHDMELMGVLASEIAHELAKPLTHIMNEGSRIASRADGVPSEGLSKIEKEAQRASEILDGFALLSPDRPLHQIAVPIKDLLEESLEALGIEEDKTLSIIRRYGELPPVYVNPVQIVQVLTNVIQNAWQAIPAGGTLTLTTLESVRDALGQTVTILIEDTGPGIPSDMMGKVFEPFFTTKQEFGGRGLGLAISRAMVERHGGRIHIESPITARGGTRVTIHLPAGHKEMNHGA